MKIHSMIKHAAILFCAVLLSGSAAHTQVPPPPPAPPATPVPWGVEWLFGGLLLVYGLYRIGKNKR